MVHIAIPIIQEINEQGEYINLDNVDDENTRNNIRNYAYSEEGFENHFNRIQDIVKNNDAMNDIYEDMIGRFILYISQLI